MGVGGQLPEAGVSDWREWLFLLFFALAVLAYHDEHYVCAFVFVCVSAYFRAITGRRL